ncbi:NACHT domain-containing protein [Streptomyces sp. NPDC001348]
MSAQLDKLAPYGFGAVAMLALLLFVARTFLTTLAGEAAKAAPSAVRRLYRRVRPVGGRKLKRYRDQVRAEHSKVRLGLSQAGREGGQGSPGLRDVYVPLHCELDGGRGDAATLLRVKRLTVLLGDPGAGKSLLLKHEMLEWADSGDDRALPVIVDLHACNSSEDPFEELITAKFRQTGISNAQDLVETRLESGGLRVFFDGLDEVATEHFERVVRQLREFAVRYSACEMVVTCRNAAYEQQLQDVFDQEIRVAEFDDASILRFLSKWPDLKDAVTAARIFQALQEDPELMVLARSPLMLTMIAYLQSGDRPESVGPLPNSRAAFYDMAVAHLLDRDRLLNRSAAIGNYHAGRKTLVLQRLAVNQLCASSARGDRQEITREQFESVIAELLPGFDLERDPHLQRMLAEIVSRSELIKDIDRGRHYRFTHLTLLEYLAACELRTDEQRLMHHYRRDPKPWRETVRMWCAVTRGSCTRVVREVFEHNDMWRKVLALQCLADAVHIDEELAEEILAYFLDRLGTPGDTQGDIAKGLGTLAASSSPRGRRVREALIAAAQEPAPARRSAALRALTVSGRQESARALARLQDPEAQTALQAMGDVAVPSLAQEAERGSMWAVRSLGAVGTPTAAVQLAGLLWTGRVAGPPTAPAAAWNLASLMNSPEVLSALSEWTAPAAQTTTREQTYPWVWEKFRHPGALKTIAARIAWLIDKSADDPAPPVGVNTIHPHIGIPLFACARFPRPLPEPHDSQLWATVDARIRTAQLTLGLHPGALSRERSRLRSIEQLFDNDQARTPAGREALKPLRDALLNLGRATLAHRAVLHALPWSVQTHLLAVRFGATYERREAALLEKWRQVHEQRPEPPRILTAVALTTGSLILGTALGLGGTRLLSTGFGWHPWGMAAWGPRWLALALIAMSVVGALLFAFGIDAESDLIAYSALFSLLFEVGCALYLFWLALASGRDLVGWTTTLVILTLLAGVCATAAILTERINEKRDNPLRTAVLATGRHHPAPWATP